MTTTQAAMQTIAPASSPGGVLDIIVLSGGPSVEREVSLQSGHAVATALDLLGHRVIAGDIGPDDLAILENEADFVFIALHGTFGEDGTIQAELDRRHMAYSGSSADVSRLVMDKVKTKNRLRQCKLPTPPYELVTAETIAGLAERFPVPAVTKPVASGSSVDTVIVKTPRQLQSAAAGLVERYGSVLVEAYIAGPELTCGIIGNQALPVCEIRTKREFYNYEAKYVDNDTEYLFDLDLPAELIRRIQEIALESHRALGCDVLSRVDFMVDADSLEPFILEINTIPGFTNHSLVPKAAQRAGMSFDRLCQRIIELSLEKPLA
ncbi:MAG: D-alanine--D-alanine ligase [Phycisphaerae bacterium]